MSVDSYSFFNILAHSHDELDSHQKTFDFSSELAVSYWYKHVDYWKTESNALLRKYKSIKLYFNYEPIKRKYILGKIYEFECPLDNKNNRYSWSTDLQCISTLTKVIADNCLRAKLGEPLIPICFGISKSGKEYPKDSYNFLVDKNSYNLITHREIQHAYRLCEDPDLLPEVRNVARQTFQFYHIENGVPESVLPPWNMCRWKSTWGEAEARGLSRTLDREWKTSLNHAYTDTPSRLKFILQSLLDQSDQLFGKWLKKLNPEEEAPHLLSSPEYVLQPIPSRVSSTNPHESESEKLSLLALGGALLILPLISFIGHSFSHKEP